MITCSTASAIETGWSRSSIWPASTFERSRMSLIRVRRCLPLVRIWPRNLVRVAWSNWPSRASVRSSEKPMIALSGVRSSWLMLARNTLLCLLASRSATLLSSSFTIRCRRSSAVTKALISCCMRFISSLPKPGVKGPATMTSVPDPDSPRTGTEMTALSTPSMSIRLTPSGRRGSRRARSTICRGSRPRLVPATPAESKSTPAPPPASRMPHSRERAARPSRSSLMSSSSMKARMPSSSSARHCRRNQAGGAKLAYSRGTIRSTISSIPTCTATWRTSRPTEIATSSTSTSPPKPRLRERRRHAWTGGSFFATSQKRTMGSPTQAIQIATTTIATANRTAVFLVRASTAKRETLAATNEAAAAACQRRGRGMMVSR